MQQQSQLPRPRILNLWRSASVLANIVRGLAEGRLDLAGQLVVWLPEVTRDASQYPIGPEHEAFFQGLEEAAEHIDAISEHTQALTRIVEKMRAAVEVIPRNPLLEAIHNPDIAPVRSGLKGGRLLLDDATLTIALDGKAYKVESLRAFQIYKALAESNSELTKAQFRTRITGLRGRKAVPRALEALPESLRRTVRVSTKGYWLDLSR